MLCCVLFCFLFTLGRFHTVLSSCFAGRIFHEKLPLDGDKWFCEHKALGRDRWYCEHKGKKIGVGSQFITDDCFKCSCDGMHGLGCCGIGARAGVFLDSTMVPGCEWSMGGGEVGCHNLFRVKSCASRKCKKRKGKTCFRDCYTGRRIPFSDFILARMKTGP